MEMYKTSEGSGSNGSRLTTAKSGTRTTPLGTRRHHACFIKDFDRVLSTAPNMEQTVVHNDLVSQDGNLLPPETSMGTDESQQQQVSDDATNVTLLMKPISGESLPLEQLQHTLGL
ncbi:unnamed protein product [Caretta caretta]